MKNKSFFKRYIKPNLLFYLIIILFLISRLINIKILPIFTDEAIYTYWAKVALNDPENRFISLIDGKQPLFIWLGAIIHFFIKEPLVATRLVSVSSGFLSVIGLYLLSKELLSKQVGLVSALLYVILPFTLLYDRMALYDSLLTMLGIWVVFFSVRLAKNPQLDLSFLTGITIGLGQITKSSANFFLYLLPFSLLLFNWNGKKIFQSFFRWMFFALIVFTISFVIYNSLRLSPYFYIIAQKNLSFIKSTSEVIQNPLEFFYPNFKSILTWIILYTGPIIIIFPVSIYFALKKRKKEIIYLLILVLAPFMAENIFNKVLYPRFLLFYYPFIIIIISYGIQNILKIKNKTAIYLLLLVLMTLPIYTSFKLITDPKGAPIPEADAAQYRDSWPAGYGVDQAVGIIRRYADKEKVVIGTEGTFGLFPYALNIYFDGNENVKIKPYWPVDPNKLPEEIIADSGSNKTFFVFNENQKEINNPNLKFVSKYQKGNGNSYMRLYEVNP